MGRMRSVVLPAVVALLVLGLAPAAHAVAIALSNTGLGAEGSAEPNYTLTSSPCASASCGGVFVAITDGYPIPPWIANNAASKWIKPQGGAVDDDPDGDYTYRTTFDLTGLDPTTASITGQWATDNAGGDILVNGISTGYATGIQSYLAFSAFSISGGFVAGLNTLDFLVNNDPCPCNNPSGLRVEMTGTAAAVPEPSTLLLMGAGVLVLLGRSRRLLAP